MESKNRGLNLAKSLLDFFLKQLSLGHRLSKPFFGLSLQQYSNAKWNLRCIAKVTLTKSGELKKLHCNILLYYKEHNARASFTCFGNS